MCRSNAGRFPRDRDREVGYWALSSSTGVRTRHYRPHRIREVGNMPSSSVTKGDPTESTVSIHDEEFVLRNLLTILSNLFISITGGGSGLISTIRSGNMRYKTSRAINDGVDTSVKSVVIPQELAHGLDPLFGYATGDPLRLVLRVGSGLGEPLSYAGEDILSVMVVSTKVVTRTDFTTGEVTTVPVDGDSIATVCWISESDIDLPVGGGIRGILSALQGAVSDARQYVTFEPENDRQADLSDDELDAIKRDLGR